MSSTPVHITLLYDDSAFVEMVRPSAGSTRDGPMGIMGRQVAGKEFLDAYLQYGTWEQLVALVRERSRADSLVRLCQEHSSSRTRKRRLQIVEEKEFHSRFFPTPPAEVLYIPSPLDVRFAWARQQGGAGAYALCGVTHTLSSLAATQQLCNLVTGPYESFDALICTSRAVRDMVQAVAGGYADYLRDRHGGTPHIRPHLEIIPLGVNEQQFRPPTPEERNLRRRQFGLREDEIAVLFVGRLSHHAKAHPAPMFRGLARAARITGKKVHLLLAGWAANPAIQQGFLSAARVFAGSMPVSILDGTDQAVRNGVWHAADVFTSLSDNIQETFGLVIVEAMAVGLPVVASDWNGYRDLVEDGETGYLVPTYLVSDATQSTTSRLVVGETNYDHFLGECSQASIVDISATTDAFVRLLSDSAKRREMGEAGRQRVLQHFTWRQVIAAYERLWSEQQRERRAWVERRPGTATTTTGPACYPSPEQSYAGYPTRWLGETTVVRSVDGSKAEMEVLLRLPLTSHVPGNRCTDGAILTCVLETVKQGCAVADLDDVFRKAEVQVERGRATLAWLLKYGLLEVIYEKDQ